MAREFGEPAGLPHGIPIGRIADQVNYVTRNGRPLMEFQASKATLRAQRRAGIVIDRVPAIPYSDDRGQYPDRPINHAAMLEIDRNRRVLLDGFSWIHHHYFGGETPAEVTVKQMHEMAVIASWLATYLVLRGTNVPGDNFIDEKSLPDVLGDMHKAAQGIAAMHTVPHYLQPDNIATVEGIYHDATTENILRPNSDPVTVEPQGQCPANPNIMRQTFAAVLSGAGGNPQRSELGRYIPDSEFDTLKRYCLFVENYNSYLNSSQATRYDLAQRVVEAQSLRSDTTSASDALVEFEFGYAQQIKVMEKRFNKLLGRDPDRIIS